MNFTKLKIVQGRPYYYFKKEPRLSTDLDIGLDILTCFYNKILFKFTPNGFKY